jgi:aryl-alcohol dehydrogenase-like predicted oxidoreductase
MRSHSWRGARGSGGEVCASFDAWPSFQKNLDLVARITDIAHDKGCTASQLALAWVMAQGVEGHGPLLSVED